MTEQSAAEANAWATNNGVLRANLIRATAERDEARADLARMKAALEIACRRGCDHCADDIREARAALKETSP